jgi:hypothetical protein
MGQKFKKERTSHTPITRGYYHSKGMPLRESVCVVCACFGTSRAILEDARRVGFEHHARPVAARVYTFHDVELLLFLDLGAYASKDAIGLEQTHLRLLEFLHPFQNSTEVYANRTTYGGIVENAAVLRYWRYQAV